MLCLATQGNALKWKNFSFFNHCAKSSCTDWNWDKFMFSSCVKFGRVLPFLSPFASLVFQSLQAGLSANTPLVHSASAYALCGLLLRQSPHSACLSRCGRRLVPLLSLTHTPSKSIIANGYFISGSLTLNSLRVTFWGFLMGKKGFH